VDHVTDSVEDRLRLRATFDQDAELYDRARPGYPEAVFADLASITGIGPGSRVLEVGCGTGKATAQLARYGCRVTGVELGPSMAAVARRNLRDFPGVEIVTADFEQWPLPAEPYDVVVSASAFHWIDLAVRLRKTAQALRPGGWLAVVEVHHVTDGHEELFAQVHACYERFPSAWPARRPGGMPSSEEIPPGLPDLAGAPWYDPPVYRRYPRTLPYTTQEFLDLSATMSIYRDAAPDVQRGLRECIAGLLDTRYGGRITKPFLVELCLARYGGGAVA
jgi:SAM-dependent methyltransferase